MKLFNQTVGQPKYYIRIFDWPVRKKRHDEVGNV